MCVPYGQSSLVIINTAIYIHSFKQHIYILLECPQDLDTHTHREFITIRLTTWICSFVEYTGNCFKCFNKKGSNYQNCAVHSIDQKNVLEFKSPTKIWKVPQPWPHKNIKQRELILHSSWYIWNVHIWFFFSRLSTFHFHIIVPETL